MVRIASVVGGVGGLMKRSLFVSSVVLPLVGCGGEGTPTSHDSSGTGGNVGEGGAPNGDGGSTSGDAGAASSDGGSASGDGGAASGGSSAQLKVDTKAPKQVVAGSAVNVTCLLLDEKGDAQMPPSGVKPSITFTPSDSVQLDEQGTAIATQAGLVEASCAFSKLKLSDKTPASFQIASGAPATVETTVDESELTAGGTVTATCKVSDAYGNVISDASPTLSVTPAPGEGAISDLSATLTQAGSYAVACTVPGAASPGTTVAVNPALPAAIVISRSPDAPSYPLGTTVEALTTVTDNFGNVIDDATLSYESVPAASNSDAGPRFFQYLTGGDGFAITATVTGATEGDVPLSATTTTFDIEGTGPSVTCDSPLDGAMVNLMPGSTLSLRGSVQGANQITSVTVNGTPVMLEDAQFSQAVTARFGVNFAEVVATDKFGKQQQKTCTFLGANQWAVPTSLYNDTISLELTQSAFDDNNRANGVTSFADIIYAVVNSQGVITTLDGAFKAANPLKPNACDAETCTFVGCVCWYRSGVEYEGIQVTGPNTVQLSLVSGGIAVKAHFSQVHVNLQVSGEVTPVPFDITGWVDFANVDVSLTLDQHLSAGKPHVTVRPNTVVTTSSNPTLDFAGVDGWIMNNVVAPLANGAVKTTLETQLQNYVTDNVNAVLDSVISGLDVNTLGSSFNVPKLDAAGAIPVSFGLGHSSLSTDSARALYGIGTKFTAPVAHSRASLGVAIPTGTVLNAPTLSAPATSGVSDHVGIYNQVLHALWRANLYDATLSGALLGGNAPAEALVDIASALPPVVNMASTPNSVELSLGAIAVSAIYPDLFTADSPLQGELGARVTATPTLVGNDLKFNTFTITELHFDTTSALSEADRATIENFLGLLVQKLANASFNDALPALPLPAFPMPATSAQFGLPTNGRLGTTSPTLSFEPRHFVLKGGFGLQ